MPFCPMSLFLLLVFDLLFDPFPLEECVVPVLFLGLLQLFLEAGYNRNIYIADLFCLAQFYYPFVTLA